MKKYLILVPAFLLFLSSCGGGADVCSCKKTMEDMSKDMEAAGSDETKMKEIATKYAADAEKCKNLGEGKSEEDLKKMAEEMKNCK